MSYQVRFQGPDGSRWLKKKGNLTNPFDPIASRALFASEQQAWQQLGRLYPDYRFRDDGRRFVEHDLPGCPILEIIIEEVAGPKRAKP